MPSPDESVMFPLGRKGVVCHPPARHDVPRCIWPKIIRRGRLAVRFNKAVVATLGLMTAVFVGAALPGSAAAPKYGPLTGSHHSEGAKVGKSAAGDVSVS